MTPTRRDNWKCYACIMHLTGRDQRRPKKVIRNKLARFMLKQAPLTFDVCTIIVEYYLEVDVNLPWKLPEHLVTSPGYYELCDAITPVKEPEVEKIVITGYQIRGAPTSYRLVIPSI